MIELLFQAVIRSIAVVIMKRPLASADQEMNGSFVIFGNDGRAPVAYEQSFMGHLVWRRVNLSMEMELLCKEAGSKLRAGVFQ